ncbi:MAG TPA: hypothetical protein PK122_04615, partial [Candidatus Paceibacterota bacterium]|nr:hypothetical protein [Candidatus Paceibacterota bacterium]
MSDSVYGRVFDSSTSGWIADVILDIENNNIDPSLAEIWAYEAIQDASISALEASIGTSMDYPYVDGSLSARDLSINELYTLVETQDPSISNLYSTKQDLIPDGTFLKESSLGTDFVWNAGLLDVSIISIDGSVNDLYNYVEDLSTYTYSHSHAQDASIADLYQEIENIPQDASIPYLFTYTLDLSTRLDNFDPAQDGSIVDLYNIKENKTDVDSSLGDLYSYVDGSLAVQTSWNTSQDASIVGLRNTDLSQDASLALKANSADVYSKTYIDGSLNKKSTFNPLSTSGWH